MRLWLSKSSAVPLREQLTTQIMLGIVSNDLKPGERLPSTRELARRYRIHPNTVSAAYRELERRGWLESRKGSGVYVRGLAADAASGAVSGLELDGLISAFLLLARGHGFTLGEVQRRVKHWLRLQPPDHFLVVESDEELLSILVAEIEAATAFRVRGVSPEEVAVEPTLLTGAAVVALYSKAERARASLPAGTSVLLLHSRSVPESLSGEKPPSEDALISVVSRWPDFLHWARVILIAAGIDPAALNFRDAREPDWQRGLRSSTFCIADTVTATLLPEGCDVRLFRVIADPSLEELRSYVSRFLSELPS
jgi:GntR family transcriptional regulator